MKKKKSISSVIVSVSVFAFTGLYAPTVFAQAVVNCTVNLSIGKNAQCSDKATLVINPDNTTNLATGCLVSTTPPNAGRCFVKTGGVLPTKNVVVDFAKSFINIKNGAKQVRVDNLMMKHDATAPAATKFTFTPTDVANTVTINIGGTANVTAGQGLGAYSGTITVRAN